MRENRERTELSFCNFSEGFIYHVSKLLVEFLVYLTWSLFQALSKNLNDFPGSLSGLQIKECAFKLERS